MYKLIIKSKKLLDNKLVEAICSFNSDNDVLVDDLIVRSTVDSFEGTALEISEQYARSYEQLAVIPKEIVVNLENIDAKRLVLREQEKQVADLQESKTLE